MKVAMVRPARGMTLIELLISIGILMTGMVCIFAFLLAGTSSHRRAIKETEAGMIAASELADIRGDFAGGKIVHSDGAEWIDLKNRPGYKINRVIFCIDPDRKDRREFFVRVRVKWTEKGDAQFVEFSSVVCNGQPRVVEP